MNPARYDGAAAAVNPRVAVCFFGITRSLKFTVKSIEKNVLQPAFAHGDCKIYAHFFDIDRVVNARSHENHLLDKDQHLLLKQSHTVLEQPDAFLKDIDFERIKAFGDYWKDDFQSLRNLLHQLHSINAVYTMALEHRPDVVIFARPDLKYHDSLAPVLRQAAGAEVGRCFAPNWQHWGDGLNDRFAVCTGRAAETYGTRFNRILDFCQSRSAPLHGEQFLRWVLEQDEIPISLISTRASRIRANGKRKRENFWPHSLTQKRRAISRFLKSKLGLRS